MPVDVTIRGADLCVRFSGWDAFWTFHRGPTIPLAHVTGARVGARNVEVRTVSFRLFGTGVPRRALAGLMRSRGGGRQLWAVYRRPDVLVVDLVEERWQRLVLQVDDPAAAAAAIDAAIGA